MRRRCHLKTFFYFKLWQPFFSAEQNHFSNFGRGSPKEHSCEIISKSGYWSRKRCHLKLFVIFSSDGQLHSSGQRNHFRIFGRESPKVLFCEILLKSGCWPARICCLKIFLILPLEAILFSGSEPFINFVSQDTFL